MALACPVPSYGRREILQKSAPADIRSLRRMLQPLDDQEFAEIKRSAKESFKTEFHHRNSSSTSYNGVHSEKRLDEPTRSRPSSGTRKNKPHPPQVFLVNRLQHIPGYYEPEKAKLPHRDLSVKESLRQQKRPYTAHTTLLQRQHMQEKVGAVPAQAAEAWLKLCPEKDRVALRSSLRIPERKISVLLPSREQDNISINRNHLMKSRETVNSPSCLFKTNGKSKNQSLQRLSQSMRKAQPIWNPTNKNAAFYRNGKDPFMDFQIHPQWHMAWHKQYDKRAPRHPPQIYAH